MPGKLKSKWAGPYIITALRSNGAAEISGSTPNSEPFVVNGRVVEEIPLQPNVA